MSDVVGAMTAAVAAMGAAGAAGAAAGAIAGALGGGGSSSLSGVTLSLQVQINGAPLDPTVAAKVIRIDVESHLALPDSIIVGFADPDHKVISDAGIVLGSTIAVGAAYSDDPDDPYLLAQGEITSIEAACDHDGNRTMVRGLDASAGLYRGRKTKAFQEMAASDIVSQLVSDASGLSVGQIDPTDVTYTVATQANQTDWEFIQQLAKENNRIAYCQTEMLYFVEPISAEDAPELGDNSSPLQPCQLLLGMNLVKLDLGITAGEQVSTVNVRGWDSDNKQAVVGTGSAGTVVASNDESPDEIAGTFGGETYTYVDVPYSDQSGADAMATALAERFGSAYVEVDGETNGTPEVMAGVPVSIAGAGSPFDGKYVVTSARHLSDRNGYRTEFAVSGYRDTTLPGLTTSMWQERRRHLIHGVVTATVSSVKDPNNAGRVQLSFPWLDDDYVSDWCRVLQPGAGSAWGTILLPEVNSEVLVAFDRGDIRAPYVIGGLYNAQDAIAPQSDTDLVDSGTGAINQRLFQSRTKHLLYFNDSASAGCILLQSGDTNHSLKFDQSGQGTVTLKSSGSITVQGNNITITAQQNLQLEGQQQLTLKSPQVQVTADSQLSISSNGTASLTATGTLSISGSMTSINS